MSSSVMSSQSVILTTAMAVSGALIFLSLARIKSLPITLHNSASHTFNNNNPSSRLRSCLASDDKKEKKKKKKRVKFADNVKDHIPKSEIKIAKFSSDKKMKRVEILKSEKFLRVSQMPSNRAALYHGILRDRVHRIECY